MAVPRHIAKVGPRQSILERSNNFKNNIPDYKSGSSPYLNQVHHILPCCTMKYARIKESVSNDKPKATYAHECLWITPWDINRQQNLILLPLWGAYVKSYKQLKAVKKGAPLPKPLPSAPFVGPKNLPCHDRDHNNKTGYNTEVTKWLKDNIWKSLSVAQQNHTTNPKSLLGQLANGERTWKTKIKARGRRVGGTVKSWINRRNKKNEWYRCFSMAGVPGPR
jgi:hypothetical protein